MDVGAKDITMVKEGVLEIYTDGSSYQKPRRGGIGFIYVYAPHDSEEDVIEEFSPPGYKQATNNQMELEACVLALNQAVESGMVARFDRVVIRTDSMYVFNHYRSAMFVWPKTQWMLRTGAPVLNADLWKRLVSCIKKCKKRVEIEWVRGHSKNIHNKQADRLAKVSANKVLSAPLAIVQARRKRSFRSTEAGSVRMRGQRMAVRIVAATYLRVQKLYRYKYEVVSKSSKFCGNVDDICSKEILRAGHTFLVTVNRNDRNPMILRMIHEIVEQTVSEPQTEPSTSSE